MPRGFSGTADPTFDYIPYAIFTQIQTTFAAMLSCTLMLSPLAILPHSILQPYATSKYKSRFSKHWPDNTVGCAPYESYDSFVSHCHTRSEAIKEPLSSIQASMSSPLSSRASGKSLAPSLPQDILLPEVNLPARYIRTPKRPPPPSDEQRPDLSIFTRMIVLQEPPMVTRLGSMRTSGKNGGPKGEWLCKGR